MGGSSGGSSTTVGYKYYAGMHVALCHGPVDALLAIKIGDKYAWDGYLPGGQLTINNEDLFGGKKREGGVSGTVDFEPGSATQGQNSYLQSFLGAAIPAFRGVAGLVFRHFYWGMNPYIKEIVVRLQRVHVRQNGLPQWYDAKAAIGTDSGRPLAIYCAFGDIGVSATRNLIRGAVFAALTEYVAALKESQSIGRVDFYRVQMGFHPAFSPDHPGGKHHRQLLRDATPAQIRHLSDIVFDLTAEYWPTGLSDAAAFFSGAPENAIKVLFFITSGEPTSANFGEESPYNFTIDQNAQAAASLVNDLPGGVLVYGFNLDNANTAYTAQVDRTPGDGVYNILPGDSGALVSKIVDLLETFDLNPAHIIRECLTDPRWGMGCQESDIDDASFSVAADTLHGEGMGISLLWDEQASVDEFIGEILRHIEGALYVDRTTGKFVLRLIRADFAVEDLISLGPESIVSVEEYSRPGVGDLVNSVVVSYWRSSDGKPSSLSADDPAMVQAQGGVVSTTVQYHGFTNPRIASRAAQRDLKALSTPLLSCTIYANRKAAALNIGDAFRFSWPDYHDGEIVMRVVGMGLGDGRSNIVRLQCVEDVFDLPIEAAVRQPDAPWTDPATDLSAPVAQIAVEAPYYEIVQRIGQRQADSLLADAPDVGYVLAAASLPQAAINAALMVDAGAGYEEAGVVDSAAVANLSADVGRLDTVLPITGGAALGEIAIGSHAQVGDELVRVDVVTETSLTVGRGILDTVPAQHASGSPVIAWDNWASSDQVEYAAGESVSVAVLPQNTYTRLPISEVTPLIVTMDQRAARPYPPADFKINGEYFPASVTGDAVLTWAARNRVQQTGGSFLDFNDVSVTPEVGTTYTLVVQNADTNAVLETRSGISALTATASAAVVSSVPYIRFTLSAVRGGLESWQKQVAVCETDFNAGVVYTDFGQYPTGSLPADWSLPWFSFSGFSGVVARAGATGGNTFYIQANGTEFRCAAKWDGAWTESDVDLLVVCEVPSGAPTAPGNHVAVAMARIGGTSSPTSSAAVVGLQPLDSTTGSVTIGEIVSGVTTTLGPVSQYGVIAGSLVGYWAIRLRLVGGVVMGKAWRLSAFSDDPAANEPPFWQGWAATAASGDGVGVMIKGTGGCYYDRVRAKAPVPGDVGAIEFLGSKQSAFTAATSTADVVMTVPPIVAEGDLLVLSMMRRQTVTVPSGWTLVASQQCANAGTTQWTDVYTKIATSTEGGGTNATPKTFSVTLAAAGRTNAVLMAFRAMDAAALQVEAFAAATTTGGPANVALPAAVAVSNDGIAVVAGSIVNHIASGTPYSEITGAGWMQVGRRSAGTTNAARHAVAIRRIDAAESTATGGVFSSNNTISQEHALVALVINKAP